MTLRFILLNAAVNDQFSIQLQVFLEQYVGYASRYLIAFGFPNVRSMRLPQILNLFTPVGKIVGLTWESLPEKSSKVTPQFF